MNHKEQLINLKKIEGQVRGLQSMIDDEKYCIDILNQLKAVKNALVSVCLLYTSPSPRDRTRSRMPSSA